MIKEICPLENCTGCMLCMNVCPKNAITISTDERGFYIPKINQNCIECNICKQKCPQLNKFELKKELPKVFASWNKNPTIRKNSTSGGIFYALSKYILEKKGYVCGVALDQNMIPKHIMINEQSDIKLLMGSKYVQSKIGSIYVDIKEKLENDCYVLFSGTPCQVMALKLYLKKNYSKLILVDIVCHGVPSPLIYINYLKFLEEKYNSSVSNIFFRYNKDSWTFFNLKVDFKNGKEYIKDANTDPYLIGFLNDYFSKECCHNCKYTTSNRVSDITIADFWGYISETKNLRNTEEGISLVLINNEKGEEYFEKITKDLIVTEKSLEEAIAGNRCLKAPYGPSKNYKKFWQDYLCIGEEKQISFISEYFLPTKVPLKRKFSLFVNDHSYMIPKFFRKKIYQLKPHIKRLIKGK